ncbi:MAG: VWA domain-containing protein [Anaerotruncus sp.]|nr:VWA domain-containing protein [Anaerotruncus sp.]
MTTSDTTATYQAQKIARWRLILGAESQKKLEQLPGGCALTPEQLLMDQALETIYHPDNNNGSSASAGHGLSNPQVSRWLGDIRSLFEREIVTILQNDAIERCGLKQLLLEPEMLQNLEPDIGLAATLLSLRTQIPARSKESARAFIRKIVDSINRMLEDDIRRSVTAALNRRQHSPLPCAAALDYKMTIERNLRHYSPTLGTIVPERVYFFEHAAHINHWTVIVDIDQSGSMGESVIYASVMSSILASMNAIRTQVVAFDTAVTDLSGYCDDPVDLLYGIQLGGGTDIEKSIAYCQSLVETPSRTLLFLISDLYEGGNQAGLVRRLEELKESGVTIISLLALADGGKPYYNEHIAQRISAMGIPCFACVPQLLPELLAAALKGHDLQAFTKKRR